MPTIKDVAREAGVSIATVSYVLNNKAASISEETRLRVLEAITRMNYKADVTARNLRAQRTRLIGYAWHEEKPGLQNAILSQFIYRLAKAAEACGYHVLTFTFPTGDPVSAYDEMIRTRRVDAFIVADTVENDPRIQFLIERRFPFASFGRANPLWDFNWVDTDGTSGVRAAVAHLVALGHRKIAMVTWPENGLTGYYRVLGYQQGLADANIAFRDNYILRGEQGIELGRSALAHFLSLSADDLPTAIVTVSDLIAVGVIQEAEQRGLEVGKDLSVIGFDDEPMSRYLRPPLTTVSQPLETICTELINMLNAQVHEQQEKTSQVLLTPHLVERASTGAPRRP
jgi:DNA-binding LacI/PurR family transcriptional regulator